MDSTLKISNNLEDRHDNSTRENDEVQWREDLARLEFEIETLRSVLLTKQREASEIKRKLGLTAVSEIRQDIQYGIQNVKDSNAYQKTSSALKSLGSYASQTFGNLRNSNAYKSVEEKVVNVKQSKSMDQIKRQLNRLKTSQSTQDIGKEMDDHTPQTPPASPQNTF